MKMTSQNEIIGVEYRQPQFKKAKYMPSYHKHKKIGDGKYIVGMCPTGARWCFRFFPYYNGSNVNLIIFAKNISQESGKLSYQYTLYRHDAQHQKEVQADTKDGTFYLEPKEKSNRKISAYLTVPGEYHATLGLSESGESLATGLHMVSFTLLSKDIWTTNFVMYIIIGIIGVVVGSLLAMIW
jgi:hypothetical protein